MAIIGLHPLETYFMRADGVCVMALLPDEDALPMPYTHSVAWPRSMVV